MRPTGPTTTSAERVDLQRGRGHALVREHPGGGLLGRGRRHRDEPQHRPRAAGEVHGRRYGAVGGGRAVVGDRDGEDARARGVPVPARSDRHGAPARGQEPLHGSPRGDATQQAVARRADHEHRGADLVGEVREHTRHRARPERDELRLLVAPARADELAGAHEPAERDPARPGQPVGVVARGGACQATPVGRVHGGDDRAQSRQARELGPQHEGVVPAGGVLVTGDDRHARSSRPSVTLAGHRSRNTTPGRSVTQPSRPPPHAHRRWLAHTAGDVREPHRVCVSPVRRGWARWRTAARPGPDRGRRGRAAGCPPGCAPR